MFIKSCSSMYGTFVMIAISWQSAHLLNKSLGRSCGLYGAKKFRLFWRFGSGVGLPYVTINQSNISFNVIVLFYLMVGGNVGGATLKASLMWLSSVS